MNTRKKNPKIVISGYYGFDNCGDEAVLLSIVHCLKKLLPDVRITVLSGNPEKTRELYGVKAVNRWNPITIKLELLTSHLLISGGGSLLQDVTSARSPLYYLGVILFARLLRKKVMIYSQGVGPLNLEENRARVKKVLDRCHALTVRDSRSAELLRELGVRRDIQITCDPVMALNRDDIHDTAFESGTAMDLLQEFGISDSAKSQRKPLLLVFVRCWKDDRHISPVAELLDSQIKKGWDVLLAPAHFPDDNEANAKLAAEMSARPFIVDKCLTAREFLALTAQADRVFSMRLHGLISAMAVGTQMAGISYDPKVDAFMEQAGLEEYCLPFDDFSLETAAQLMERLDSPPSSNIHVNEERRLEMQKLAWKAAEKAIELL